MADEPEAGGLTPAEQKYMDSGGTTPLDTSPKEEAPELPLEAKEQPAQEQAESEPKHTTVPLGALQEERQRRQQHEAELREARDRLARYEERFSIIDRLNQPQQQPRPDPREDPVAAVEQHERELAQYRQQRAQEQEARQQQEQANRIVGWAKEQEQEFAAKSPDYFQAVDFLKQGRAQELAAFGIRPAAIQAQIQQEEWQIIAAAHQLDRSPAEIAYTIARQRGFQPTKPNGAGNGATKLQSIAAGQEANRSLSSAGGSAGGDEMTAERLVAMPIDEFEAWCNKNPAKARRLKGG